MRKWLLPTLLSLSLACGTLPIAQQAGSKLTAIQLAGATSAAGPFEVPGDSHKALIPPLVSFIQKQGYVVEFSEEYTDQCGCMGMTDWTHHMMWIESSQSPNSQVGTLLHEEAHVLFHEQSKNREVHEIVAEMSAYLAAGKLGLNTQPYSFNYLSQYDIALRDKVTQQYAADIERITNRLVEAARRGE